MSLMPAPNLAVARLVWYRMRQRPARPCGGFFVLQADKTVTRYLKAYRGLDEMNGLLHSHGGRDCIVFITVGLNWFESLLANEQYHPWWDWFGGACKTQEAPDTQTGLKDDLLAVGVSRTKNGTRPTGQFRESQEAEWYYEAPGEVIKWFGIELGLVPYLKLTQQPTSISGIARSFRDATTPEGVAEAFRGVVASDEFQHLSPASE